MLRGALLELEQGWQGTYEVRIHSTDKLLGSTEGMKIFSGRSQSTEYWLSHRDNGGKGRFQPERVGRLVTDRPKLVRARQMARGHFQT